MPEETILSRIKSPADLKQLTYPEMTALCGEIRDFLIQTVSQTGGHLSSNLGVVELTVALHKVFDTPLDRLVWDVGHQCYPHKLLTGRMEQFHTLRQENGLGGFPRPSESEYDTFIAGHSSTSISAANGMAKAKTLAGEDGYVVAIIGDGALTGGLAYEGLSNAGRSKDKLVVVLNDNRMSISRNVGFVARYLANLRAKPRYVRFKNAFVNFLSHIPLLGKGLYNCLIRVKTKLKQAVYKNSSMFEQMGFHYLGPIDGHDLKDLTRAMETAKKINRPVLLHVETIKGKGYTFAAESPDRYHGVGKFDVETGQAPESAPSFSTTFGECLCRLAKDDPEICAITAAMNGTAIDADWTGTLATGSVVLTDLNTAVAAEGTQDAIDAVKAELENGTRQVFDVNTFTVDGSKLDTYKADVDTDADYTPDTEVIVDGAFRESTFRSAPYFDLRIDGITLLDEVYG